LNNLEHQEQMLYEWRVMKRDMQLRILFIIVVMVGMLLVLPVVSQAQDGDDPSHESAVEATVVEEAAATEDQPEGVGVLILLVGLGGVTIVGGVMIGRDAFKGDGALAA
jgi:hypothetical protein